MMHEKRTNIVFLKITMQVNETCLQEIVVQVQTDQLEILNRCRSEVILKDGDAQELPTHIFVEFSSFQSRGIPLGC